MRQHGIWAQQWRLCDRCGFLHPSSLLFRQKGIIVCQCHSCVDNLLIERRPITISQLLQSTTEFESTLTRVYEDPGEMIF